MNISRRKILHILFGIVVLTGISISASLDQGTERLYSVEGAWLCELKLSDEPGAPVFRYMDIYVSNSTKPGVSGIILCTLHPWDFSSPMGTVDTTESGQGNWIRIDKNKFAFTVYRIIADGFGMAVGTVKFWGTITVTAENEFSGTLNAMYYDSEGLPFASIPTAQATGKRIDVEVEEQQ